MKLVFATNNAHKLEEARQILSAYVDVISLHDAGFDNDIEETGQTLEENASIKSATVWGSIKRMWRRPSISGRSSWLA